MAFCGECEYFTNCRVGDDTDTACDMFYPDVYMEVYHPEECEKYHQYLVEKNKESQTMLFIIDQLKYDTDKMELISGVWIFCKRNKGIYKRRARSSDYYISGYSIAAECIS